jgi:hypothetical protein
MKAIKISANFEVDEMIEFDIEKALKHYNSRPAKAKNLVKLILSDFGLENIEVDIKDRPNFIKVYLYKDNKLKSGDKVKTTINKLKKYDLVVEKVENDSVYLRRQNDGLIEGSFNIAMVDKKEVIKC